MAFKEVASLDADTTISLGGFNKKTKKDNPKSAEGYYLGSRSVTTKTGPANLHFFQTPKGNLGVWGKTDMDRKLGSVTPGTMVRISFNRMTPTPRGDMYDYKVEVDTTNLIEVSEEMNTSASDDAGGSDEAYDDGDSAGDDNDASSEEDDAVQAAELAALEAKAAAQKAKVQEILKRGKKA